MTEFNLVEVKVPALNKLRDWLVSGFGANVGARLALWQAIDDSKTREIKAKTDANIQLIEANRDAEIQLIKATTDAKVRQLQVEPESNTRELIKREQAEAREYVASGELEPGRHAQIRSEDIQKAMEFQAKKRLTNVGAIAGHAAEELRDTEVPDHDPDPDWIARFFDGAQDVSSEELQRLWGRILAGEVKSPGQTSLHTLSILRNMTQQEAKDFSDLMRFRISCSIFIEGISRVDKRFDHLIVHFSHIGLLGGFGAYEKVTLEDNGKRVVKYCSHALIVEGPSNFNLGYTIMDHTRLITFAGLEIAKLCQHQEPDMTYLSHFARFLAEKNCKLKLVPAVELDDQSAFIGVERVIEPFVEPKDRDQEEPGNAK